MTRKKFRISELNEQEYQALDMQEQLFTRLSEANIMRLDSATARKRRLRHATLMAAKEANDPLYIQYAKVSKRRIQLRERIQVKYESKGKLKLAEYEARQRQRQQS